MSALQIYAAGTFQLVVGDIWCQFEIPWGGGVSPSQLNTDKQMLSQL